jgi:hypothetical protein
VRETVGLIDSMDTECDIFGHYSRGNLLARLNAALMEDGIDPDHLTMEQLAPYDQFHGRGLEAMLEIAELMEADSTSHLPGHWQRNRWAPAGA